MTLLGCAALGLPLAVRAQPAHPIPKVGWLKIQGRQHTPGQLKAFREGMKALGLVEGRDFVLEERYADPLQNELTGNQCLPGGRYPMAALPALSAIPLNSAAVQALTVLT